MRVLVLGSRGFPGRQVVAALASSGWAQPVEAAHSGPLEQLLAGADSVANCVTGRPTDILSAARALYAAAAAAGRTLPIVHLGSMTVYGSSSGLLAEDSPTPADLGAYSRAQLEAEALAAQYPAAIRLRPGCEFGPDCWPWSGRIAQWLIERRIGDLGAAGDGFCNLLYVDDLVGAVLHALQHPELRGKVFNLGMSQPPTWNEFLVRFARALRAVPVRRVTRRRLAIETKLLAPPLKIAESLVGALRLPRMRLPAPIPPSFLGACRQEIRLNVSAAEASLGMKWTGFDAALERTAEWCRLSGLVPRPR